MSKINLTNEQINYIAAHIEEEEREIYPNPNNMDYIACVDSIIRDAIAGWNGGVNASLHDLLREEKKDE